MLIYQRLIPIKSNYINHLPIVCQRVNPLNHHKISLNHRKIPLNHHKTIIKPPFNHIKPSLNHHFLCQVVLFPMQRDKKRVRCDRWARLRSSPSLMASTADACCGAAGGCCRGMHHKCKIMCAMIW